MFSIVRTELTRLPFMKVKKKAIGKVQEIAEYVVVNPARRRELNEVPRKVNPWQDSFS